MITKGDTLTEGKGTWPVDDYICIHAVSTILITYINNRRRTGKLVERISMERYKMLENLLY
jgi:hypothetical protein